MIAGTVLRPDGNTGAARVLIVATRSGTDSVVARTVAQQDGRFRFAVPPGAIRLRVLRIGYRPFVAGEFHLAAGEQRTLRATLPNDPVQLQAVVARASTSCRQEGSAGSAAVAAFEQISTALMYTQERSSDLMARVSLARSHRTISDKPTGEPVVRFAEGPSSRPFQSLPPDSLAKVGYVVWDSDSTAYRAPDATVLLSPRFAEDHCFRVVNGDGERAGLMGLEFRPARVTRGFVDISGVLWVDRASAELRRLEFAYEGMRANNLHGKVGGFVDYTRLADESWFENRWEIRMPRSMLGMQLTERPMGLEVVGGEVWRVWRAERMLYTNGRREPQVAMIANAASARPLTDSTTRPGIWSDTLSSMAVCGATAAPGGRLIGVLRDSDGEPMADATVIVEWQRGHEFQDSQRSSNRGIRYETVQLKQPSGPDGFFQFCGVRIDWHLKVWAQTGRRTTEPVVMRLNRDDPDASVALQFQKYEADSRPGRWAMIRVRDIANQPVRSALVEIDGGVARITDDSGQLRVRADGPDTLPLRVRKIGLTPFEGPVARDASRQAFDVVLSPLAQRLNEVSVWASAATALAQRGFYDRMRRAQRGGTAAEFVTPEELADRPTARLSDLFQNRRLVAVQRTVSTRPVAFLSGSRRCFATVLVDGRRAMADEKLVTDPSKNVESTATEDGKVVNLDILASSGTVAGIEIYPSASSAPAELLTAAGGTQSESCAIVAIWTGR